MQRPTAVGQRCGPIEKEEIQRAAPGTQTVGQMAMRVHMGWRVCPSVLLALCIYMNACVCFPACACVKLHDLMYHMCTYGLSIFVQVHTHKSVGLCVSTCEGNKLLFGQFTGSDITTTTGQTDPQRERLVRKSGAKNTALLTSVGQQQYATTHGLSTWHSSTQTHEYKKQIGRDPVGPVC